MAALYDSRGMFEDACVPTKTALSQKVKSFIRGSFSTGTTGYGFVAVNALGANAISGGTVTQPGSVMTSATILSAASLLAGIGSNNSSLTTATNMQTRIVGATLYVKYAGTQLNKGGDMVLIESPTHSDVTAFSYNTALALDGVKRVKVTDDWTSVSWVPTSATETDFVGAVSTTLTLAIICNSAGAPQPFDFEVYVWSEWIGPLARSATLSFNDPIGFAAVTGAAEQFQQLDSELGAEGFVRAVEVQLANQSLPQGEPPHKNWAGLLSFLPQLATLAAPFLKSALGGAVNGVAKSMGYSKEKGKEGPRQTYVAPPPPPPPPPRRTAAPAARPAQLQAAKKALKPAAKRR